MGSPGVAAWIAYVAFFVLVVYGMASRQLTWRGLIAALTACVAARVLLAYVPYGGGMFSSAVAIIDIALVFAVFKRDLKL
jgi:hypothetical protein